MKLRCFPDWQQLGAAIALACLFAACAAQGQRSMMRDEPAAKPKTLPSNKVAPNPSPSSLFAQAIAQANSAATMAATAKTQVQWQAAATKWRQAIELLKAVPKTDPNYQTAQEKLKQYQPKLDSAVKKASQTQ